MATTGACPRRLVFLGLLPALLLMLSPQAAGAMQRLCGRRLADTLALVCAGRGFYWEVAKRGGQAAQPPQVPSLSEQLEDQLQEPKELEQQSDTNSIEKTRTKRSIVEECCTTTCTFAMLESYCAPSAGPSWKSRDMLAMVRPTFSSIQGSQGAASGLGQRPAASGGQHQTLANHQQPGRPRLGHVPGFMKNRPFFFVTPARRDPLDRYLKH